MRSFFCDHCQLEFDLDGDFDESEDAVFCPRCKIHLARLLPETPERTLLREERIRQARRRQIREALKRMVWSVLILAAVFLLIRFRGQSAWLMLFAGVLAGFPAGCWIRRLTEERSWRSGFAAAVLVLLVLSAMVTVLYLTGLLPGFHPALRNLSAGLLSAWLVAVFERKPV